jgi:flagellar motor switch protein FliG
MADRDLRKAAVMLMSLPARQAAMLLGKLSAENASAVLATMAGVDQVGHDEQEAAIRELSEGIRGCSSVAQARRHGGMPGLVKILNAMHPPCERRLLGEIGRAAPDLFQDIRRAIFGADVAALEETTQQLDPT